MQCTLHSHNNYIHNASCVCDVAVIAMADFKQTQSTWIEAPARGSVRAIVTQVWYIKSTLFTFSYGNVYRSKCNILCAVEVCTAAQRELSTSRLVRWANVQLHTHGPIYITVCVCVCIDRIGTSINVFDYCLLPFLFIWYTFSVPHMLMPEMHPFFFHSISHWFGLV